MIRSVAVKRLGQATLSHVGVAAPAGPVNVRPIMAKAPKTARASSPVDPFDDPNCIRISEATLQTDAEQSEREYIAATAFAKIEPQSIAELRQQARHWQELLASGWKFQVAADGPQIVSDLWDRMRKLADGRVPPMPEMKAARPVDLFMRSVRDGYPGPRKDELAKAMDAVIAFCDADNGKPQKRTRKPSKGRPPKYDPAPDRRLVADWQAAKKAGATRDTFCRGRGIEVFDLTAAQDRLRSHRNRGAD